MSQDYIYKPLSGRRDIRVLSLRPSQSLEADVQCSLTKISLDSIAEETPIYDALSYVWGAKHGTVPILCDGSRMLVTPNCDSALRHLRHRRKSVSLWVDAICINQGDIVERAQQVTIMSDVYHLARTVIIWLGAETTETAVWIRRASRYAFLERTHESAPSTISFMFQMPTRWSKNRMPPTEHLRLLNHEWATRVWTVPELFMARNAVVRCGKRRLPWLSFYTAITAVPRSVMLPYVSDPAGMPEFYDQYTKTIIRWASRSELRKMPVFNPLGHTWHLLLTGITSCIQASRSSDPLDKAFVFWPQLSRLGLKLPEISYEMTLDSATRSFTLATMECVSQFWIAWVQPWRPLEDSAASSWSINLLAETSLTFITLTLPLRDAEYNATRASKLHPQSLEMSATTRRIRMKGKKMGCIASVGPQWGSYPRLYSQDIDNQDLKDLNRWLLFWARLYEKGSQTYPSLGAFADRVCETLLGWRDDVQTLKSVLRPNIEDNLRALGSLNQDVSDRAEGESSSLFHWDFPLNLPTISFPFGFLAEAQPFVVDDERIGWTRSLLKEGDLIILAAGSDWPLILRAQQDEWQYVGPVEYVYGIMKGEEWPEDIDVDALETFSLV